MYKSGRNSSLSSARNAIIMTLLVSQIVAAEPSYEIVELPPPNPNGASHGRGINESGTVVGLAFMPDGSYRAARWDDGVPVDLGATPGFGYSTALDITDEGRIFGRSGDVCQFAQPAYWELSQPYPLPGINPPFVEIFSANETGVAVGEGLYSCNRPWNDTGFKWEYIAEDDNWVVSTLPPLSGDTESGAYGVNDAGVVVGYSGNSGGTARLTACQWIGGVPSLLPDLGGNYSIGMAINAAGRFAGYSKTAGEAFRAFYYDGATAINLGTLPGYAYSAATSLNDSGTVIGFAFNGSTEKRIFPYWFHDTNHRAFMWRDGVLYDANALIPPETGWTSLESLMAINNRGQITGIGVRGGRHRGFLLTPILQGDMNCDLAVDLADVPQFVAALLMTGFTGCDMHRADMNQDALIDGRDTMQFVDAVLAS